MGRVGRPDRADVRRLLAASVLPWVFLGSMGCAGEGPEPDLADLFMAAARCWSMTRLWPPSRGVFRWRSESASESASAVFLSQCSGHQVGPSRATPRRGLP